MKEFESPRFLASGQWIDDEHRDQPASALSRFRRRRERTERVRKYWAGAMALHDEIFARWSDYELDLAKLIDYPAMSDLREAPTVAMIKAMRQAQRLRPAGTGNDAGTPFAGSEAAAVEYGNAVRDFEEKFLVAEAEAKRIKRGHYSAAEQERLRTARQMLNIAFDDGSSPSERQGAYVQLRKTVDGLLHLPERALAALESRRSEHDHDGGQGHDIKNGGEGPVPR